ncbi:DNA adenine methylase [Marinilactibacillus psychrotolerans]|uniref:DNA adenine methylase n=1 Tax=Marinilactibacillus psychrotolerans TaxID=191770 RepID=A0A5R9C6U5_9LACT|nr:DNA adenine methylase [Marinilactibacillus psychrotolerans]TLQ08814.1 DNA adenine methylase [Marinilactibacillus psychrotolerans]
MKRILNYPGSKWSMASTIVNIMPEHKTYVEPFFGSGAVFFNKPKTKVETINDLDSRLINFFKVCRENPDKLIKAIQFTPHSREEYQLSYIVADDPIEDARRLMIRCWQAIGAKTSDITGWRSLIESNGPDTSNEWANIWKRIEEVAIRLKGVQIEHQDAVKLLERYSRKDVLTYVDPPYLLETRSKRHYKHEFTNEDHENLLNCLLLFKGKVILSGYESSMYNSYLKDWHKVYINSNAEAGASRTEVLWTNFEPIGQIDLMEYLEGVKQ